MAKKFTYNLHATAGATEVTLTLSEEDRASILYHWGGMGPTQRYSIECAHEKLSEAHGILRLHSVARYVPSSGTNVPVEMKDILGDPTVPDEVRADSSEITFNELMYEYLRLQKSEVRIANDPGLEAMRSVGSAHWNETFDLILLLHSSTDWLVDTIKETDFGELLRELDKMKFTSVS